MKFNSKVGLGKFSDTSCSTNLYITTEPRYSIQTGYEMNYRSYVELAWNTNGSSYDLNYFDSQTTTYCVNYATQAFTYGTLQSTICIPQGKNLYFKEEILSGTLMYSSTNSNFIIPFFRTSSRYATVLI